LRRGFAPHPAGGANSAENEVFKKGNPGNLIKVWFGAVQSVSKLLNSEINLGVYSEIGARQQFT